MSDTLLDLADGDYFADVPWRGMVRHVGEDMGLTASVIPVNPPRSWFDDPKLSSLTPLTVDKTGKVFGHIAAWHTSHIGLAGGVKPPRSKSNYTFFRTGVVETSDGEMVDVGQITLAGGHAPLEASVARAVAHYDDTKSAVMDVAAGEDKHGIWVAGALRPGVTEEQIRTIRASSVSGDWRPINGRLELVAICAVNTPGFPIPRARVAAGAPIALVAAGTEPLVERSLELQREEDFTLGLETFNQRISHLEQVLASIGVDGLTVPDASEAAEDLRRRVYGETSESTEVVDTGVAPQDLDNLDSPDASGDKEAVMAALRARVVGKKAAGDLADELRKRVRGS